jgi:hypothetical protein
MLHLSLSVRSPVLLASVASAFVCGAQLWPEVQISAPIEVTAGGRFGAAMSMEGDWLLVGAPGTNDGAPGAGAAYLYNRYEGGENAWGLVKKLVPPAPAGGAAFGSAVLLQGARAYISAPGEPWLVLPVGAVHVFERDLGGNGNWGYKQRVMPDTVQSGLRSGVSLDADNDLLLVNAPGYDESMDDGLPGLGAVVGFTRDSTSVLHETRFVRGDALVDEVHEPPCVDDWLTIFAGRLVHAGFYGAFSTAVAPFSFPDSPLEPAMPMPLPAGPGIPAVPIYFARGASDQSHLLLGVRNFSARAPRLVSYVPDGQGQFLQDGIIHPPDTNASITWWHWGEAVDIEGPLVVVGAYGDETFTPLGHADVFRRDADAPFGWAFHAGLLPTMPNTGDQFGRSVAIADGNVAVGAPGFGPDDLGRAYVFRDPTAGIPVASSTGDMARVFPNPADRDTRILHFACPGPVTDGTIRVFTQDGRTVLERSYAGQPVLYLPSLAAGNYIATVRPADPRLPSHAARFSVLP